MDSIISAPPIRHHHDAKNNNLNYMGCTHNVKKKDAEEPSVTDSFSFHLLHPVVLIEALRQFPD